MASLTIENYVKAIYLLCNDHGREVASTGQLADALEVAPGTVTAMLKTLSEAGLARYTPYEGARLTTSGEALALRVLRRHRLIELFLVQTLGLSWDEVHEEAENMEHAVSDFLVDRIDRFLGRPVRDPHGDPIPQPDGTIASSPAHTLAEWPPERPFRLVRVLDQSSEVLRFLSESGIAPGGEGHLEECHASAGIVRVTLDGVTTTISRELAAKLLVTAADTSPSD